jgi:deoxyadenosine/deoxycytidine kinase
MFQTMVFKTRIQSLEKEQISPFRFSERSIWTDRFVFGKMCLEDNKMNSIESSCYKFWFEWLEEKFKPKPDGIIYIKCSPEKCLERISQRGRNEENKIPIACAMGGGYSPKIADIVDAHCNTFKAAINLFD